MGDSATRVSDPPAAKILSAISSIPRDAWNACAGDNPFLRHEFLNALEESQSVCPQTGWAPQHLVLKTPDGQLAGCVPLYLKGHSQGEYVFDHGWASAFERAGGAYYPKLLSAVPFTPVTGNRLLLRDNADPALQTRLLETCMEAARQMEVSSLHFNFLPEEQASVMQDAGLLLRTDQQFHWENPGYGNFDEFLAELSSRKRKTIRRERRLAGESGITIRHLTGSDIAEHHWDAFFSFYIDTGLRKWGHPYLTREFFSLAGAEMSDSILLILCERDGLPVAGALNFIGGDTLYGRHWGSVEEHPFLHFEACYYQAMEFAIARGLTRVEAGAQGMHKLARGYLPQQTYSAHYIANPAFRQAVRHYLEHERRAVKDDIAVLNRHTPFRHNPGDNHDV